MQNDPNNDASSDHLIFPAEMVCMSDPNTPGAMIIGFRIREGDQAYGRYGMSEPLEWLKRVISDALRAP